MTEALYASCSKAAISSAACVGLEVDAGDGGGTRPGAGSNPLSDDADLALFVAFDLRRVLVPAVAAALAGCACFLDVGRGLSLDALLLEDDRFDFLPLRPDPVLDFRRCLLFCPSPDRDDLDFCPDDD